MKSISVVIPALNEELGIEKTIRSIPINEIRQRGYETQVVVVDGNSKDRTREFAKRSGAEVVIEPIRGYGQAFKTGFVVARGDLIVTTDADATYPVEDIPKMIGILETENLDFITTNRFAYMGNGAMSFRNKVGNAVLNFTERMLFRIDLKDCQSGMWLFKRSLLDRLVLKSNTPFSQEIKIEACHFAGCRWKEIPIQYRPREGKAKLGGWKVGLGNLFHLFKKRVAR